MGIGDHETRSRQHERENPPIAATIDGLRAGLGAESFSSTSTPSPIGLIVPDELLQTTSVNHVLPRVALDLRPELRGTVWNRIGYKAACTILAHALLGGDCDERISLFASWLARILTANGDAIVLDGKTLVTGDGVTIAFADRTIYVMRCDS